MGGVEVWCDVFARGMIDRGHKVCIVAQKMRSPHPMPELPYPVHLFRRPPRQHLLAEFFAWPLIRAWRRHRFDIVIINYGYPLGYAASLLKRRLKFATLVVAHGNDLYENFNEKRKMRIERLRRAGYERADHIVAVSRILAQRAAKVIAPAATPISIIHNATDLADWRAKLEQARHARPSVASEFDLAPGQFTLQVAGLRHVKRPDLAIGAVARCKDLYDRLNLKHVMVGTGKDPQQYYALARSLGISHRIAFAGLRTGDDKFWLFANARLLLHTSDEEGLPIVLTEAAASGLPLLASDILPHVDFIGNSNCGKTFPHGNLDALAPLLADMLQQNLTPLANASRTRALDFNLPQMLDAYESLCQSLLATRN